MNTEYYKTELKLEWKKWISNLQTLFNIRNHEQTDSIAHRFRSMIAVWFAATRQNTCTECLRQFRTQRYNIIVHVLTATNLDSLPKWLAT